MNDTPTAGFELWLPGGERVWIRPLTRADRPLLAEGMASLSASSRYFRFFSPIGKLPSALLDYLVDTDHTRHFAWIAFTEIQHKQVGVGVARLICLAEEPGVAEIALVVIDAFQNRGLGAQFLAVLYQTAIRENIRILRANMLAENRAMINWLHRLGARMQWQEPVLMAELAVVENPDFFTETRSGQNLLQALRRIPV